MSNQIINANLAVVETALSFPEKARALTITDEATLRSVNEFLVADKQMQKLVHAAFDPTVDATKEAHNMALAQRARYLNPLIEAEKIAKPKIGAWLTEQARIRQEAIEKAKREADAKEEARLQKLQAAIDAENAGKSEEAEKHFEEAISIEPPKPVIPPAVKVQGTYLRKELKWRVVDLAAVPHDFLMVNHAEVNMVFRSLGKAMNIPGIEVYEETNVISRS